MQEASEFERTPTDEEILIYLLFENFFMVKKELVEPEWFSNFYLKTLWGQIIDWYTKGKDKDYFLFSAEYKNNFFPLWARCDRNVTEYRNFEAYVELLKLAAWRRETLDGAKNKTLTDREFKDKVLESQAILKLDQKDEVNIHSPREYIPVFLKELEERRGKAVEFPTGFQRLDEFTYGLHKGEIFTIGARTGKGKSVFCLNVALNLVKLKKKVLYFSTEMTAYEKWLRIMSLNTSIEFWKFRAGNLSLSEWDRVGESSEKFHDGNNFIVCDKASPSVSDIQYAIRTHVPDVVILDYIGLCHFPKADRKDLEIAEFMKQIKITARQLNVAFLIASQLNREVDKRPNKIPTLADFKESGAIEQDSDVACLMWHDKEEFVSDVKDIKLNVEKNRHGACAIVDLNFNMPYLKLVDKL